MNPMRHSIHPRRGWTLLALLFCAAAQAQITFTVTPTSISNNYSGNIILQIGGLTNGESVVVQKFLDVNANGIVDAADWLVQQFALTDGRPGMVIGGVTNMNVPGDADAVGGQITAKFKFATGDFMQSLVGRYAFVLSSPGGHFTPLTNALTITNAPYAQTFSGTVVSNHTAIPMPASVVLLFPPPRPGKGGPGGSPVAGVVTDSAGNYSVQAPAGTYLLGAFKGGCFTDFGAAPTVVLSASLPVITNLAVASAPASISGTVQDAATPATGLPGVMVIAQSATGLLGVTTSDPNGNFVAPGSTNAASWGLAPNAASLNVLGYVGPQNRISATPGSTGVGLPATHATALFYGTVTDGAGNPLVGVGVSSSDNASLYQDDAHTDSKGGYFALALAGSWGVSISTENSPANLMFSQSLGLSLTNGQAVGWNFTGVAATNQITGWLRDTNGNPFANVGMWANTTINGVYYNQGNAQTDSSGNYAIPVANGTWQVGVNIGGSGNSLPTGYICSTSLNVVVSNANATADFTVLAATNAITGSVVQTNGSPLVGVGVWALATIGGITYAVQTGTDDSGHFSLPVAAASWNVGVFCNGGGGGWQTLDGILGPGTYACPASQMVNFATGGAVANFVVGPGQPLQITPAVLHNGTVGVLYSAFLGASGGQPPYSWMLPGGTFSLPPTAGGDMSFLFGGTGATISGIPAVAGNYPFSVVLLDSASPQNVVTQAFSITINSRPYLGLPSWTGNQFQMRLNGATGQNYTVQMATSLSASNWITLYTTNNLATNAFNVLDRAAADRQRFYRVLVGP